MAEMNPNDKYVNPIYSRDSGNPPIDPKFGRGFVPKVKGPQIKMPEKRWGAGNPNYVADMIARGKAKKAN